MFIGWARPSFESDVERFSEHVLCDKSLLLKNHSRYPNLTFVAYEGGDIKALIAAAHFEKTLMINHFYYTADVDDEVKERLLRLLLGNIESVDEQPLLVLARVEERELFANRGFEVYGRFTLALYSGERVAFNFSSAMGKSISSENYLPIVKMLDKKAYLEDRTEYLTDMSKSSSLMLSTTTGYQHSYGLGKNIIKISPWVMEDASFSDAEKLLRGVIYHRGLKKIIAFIPSDIKEITDLYKSYKFELKDRMLLMYKNHKPSINLEMIYGL